MISEFEFDRLSPGDKLILTSEPSRVSSLPIGEIYILDGYPTVKRIQVLRLVTGFDYWFDKPNFLRCFDTPSSLRDKKIDEILWK